MKLSITIFLIFNFFNIYSQDIDQQSIDEVYTWNVTPFNIGITYNDKIGLNAEVDIYLPRTIEYTIYEVKSLIMKGPFLCLNLGWRGSGLGLGYGMFIRSMGTIGFNFKVKTIYTYSSNKYIDKNKFYLNPEIEVILAFNNLELGLLREFNFEEGSENMIYWGWGIKF